MNQSLQLQLQMQQMMMLFQELSKEISQMGEAASTAMQNVH